MAIQPTPGGLNQVRPPEPAKQENLAARAAGMAQEEEQTEAKPEDFVARTMRELQEQRKALNEISDRLKSSLDTRIMGFSFDPVMMAAAAGFLKPTKTGSFGESLGHVAESVSSEAEKQLIRQQAAQKMQLELQEKLKALSQQEGMLNFRQSMLGEAPPQAAPAAVGAEGAAPEGAPRGAPGVVTAAAPAGGPSTLTGAPRQMRMITDRDIQQAYMMDPSGKLGKELESIAKMQREDVSDIGGRPYSRSRQEFLPGDPNKPLKYNFGIYIGDKDTTAGVVQQYEALREKALREKDPNIVFNFFKSMGWLEGEIELTKAELAARGQPAKPEEGAAVKPGEPTRPKTLEEKKLEEAITTKRMESQIQGEKEAITKLDTNFTQARDLINAARSMKGYATSNPRAFDLMNDDGVANAVMRAANQGIQLGNLGSISIPTDTLYQGSKLSKEDRETLQMFARDYANLKVAFRKAARVPGEGATTDREGDMYASLGALPTDTARVIRLKSEFVELKGRYDQEVFRAWSKYSKDPKNSYRDFLASDALERINNAYDKRLEQMQRANADLLTPPKQEVKTQTKPGAAPTQAPPPPPQIKSKSDPVFKNLPVGKTYFDTDGTVRRKKEGE